VSRRTAPFGRRLARVVSNDALGAYTLLRLAEGGREGESPRDGRAGGWAGRRAPNPGQFAMLAAAEQWGGGEDERPFLPRAFSIARSTDGEAHFLIDPVGPGTRRLCGLRPGEGVWMTGPLGVGFTAPGEGRRAILVGGGAGIAPLAILQDTLLGGPPVECSPALAPDGSSARSSSRADAGPAHRAPAVLLGFRDRARAEGAALLRDAHVATDDGSVGHHGPVTDLLRAELDRAEDPPATVYACGPAPMLEAVRALCAERSVPAQLALEAPMACGFGACFGCVVPRRDGAYVRVCVDGPVFDASEFDRIDSHAGALS
jgi:dihydroorotate dehydrogenase electron transfer subunit